MFQLNLLWQSLFEKKAMQLTKEEVPHAITCYVENYEETTDLIKVQVLIVVDRLSLKKSLLAKMVAC